MQRLVRSEFQKEGYSFARRAIEIARRRGVTRIAYLASNENPFAPSPKAIEMASAALQTANRYPDERMGDLERALRECHGDYRFVTGVGMDGVIETLVRTLIDPGDVVAVSTPTFSFYGIAARAQGGIVHTIPRRKDFSIDPTDFVDRCREAKISFICSPNNPTGNAIPPDVIATILDEIEGLLFLDNAYVEFSAYDYRPLMKTYENLVLGRTFSKAFALAGLRIGYAFVPVWLDAYYRQAQTPFTLNSVSAAAAIGALADMSQVEIIVQHVARWRERYQDEIPFPTASSDANFVLVDVQPYTGDEAVELLAARGVIVRSSTGFPGLGDHYIRVSIGDDWENELFLTEINAL